MNLDEAIAVYLYLQHRPPGSISQIEREALAAAWRAICQQAEGAIARSPTRILAEGQYRRPDIG